MLWQNDGRTGLVGLAAHVGDVDALRLVEALLGHEDDFIELLLQQLVCEIDVQLLERVHLHKRCGRAWWRGGGGGARAGLDGTLGLG